MNHQSSTFSSVSQQELERYLLDSDLLDQEQLTLAKKIQVRQEGPLLMILFQLSFIDLQQFSGLLDWTTVNSYQ
jgi:hypothetical protein